MIEQTAPLPASGRSAPRRSRWPGMVAADLAGFGALAVVSLLTGLLINHGRRQPLPLVYRSKAERLDAAVARLDPGAPPVVPAVTAGSPREIGLDEFQAFVSGRKGVVLDARSSFFYREGHVPGAVNVSREGFDADYRRAGGQLGAHKADAIAIYCSGADCRDSNLVADALRGLGFRRLLVYREGWEEWSQSGLPQEK